MHSSWHHHPSLTFNRAGELIAARPVIFTACAHNDACVCQQCKNNSNNNYCSPHIHPSLFNKVHLQKQNRFASEDGFYFTATFDTTPLTVRASYTVGTGWYHHGNLTPGWISAGPPPLLAAKAGRKYHCPLSMSLRCTPPQGAFSGLYSLDTIFCGFSGYQRPPWLSSRVPFALAGLGLPLVTAGRECSV